MTLGLLIDVLKALPSDLNLRIAAPICLQPRGVMSYRGYYEDLSIDFEESHTTLHIADFLSTLSAAVGETFVGYKGGDYKMSRSSRVWISKYSEASGALVTGVENDKHTAWITFSMEKWNL